MAGRKGKRGINNRGVKAGGNRDANSTNLERGLEQEIEEVSNLELLKKNRGMWKRGRQRRADCTLDLLARPVPGQPDAICSSDNAEAGPQEKREGGRKEKRETGDHSWGEKHTLMPGEKESRFRGKLC